MTNCDVAGLLAEKDLGDAGRVLVILEGIGAKGKEGAIAEERFHSYVFLLSCNGLVPSGYRFIFEPLPYSSEMGDSVVHLQDAGYVSRLHSISITDMGEKWVTEALQSDLGRITECIGSQVREWASYNAAELFEAAYTAYSSRY